MYYFISNNYKMKLIFKLLIFTYINFTEAFIISKPIYIKNNNIRLTYLKRKTITSNLKNNNPISFKNNKILFYGVESTPDIWAIISVYLVQGIIGLSSLAISFYYKDTLHISPSELTFLSSITVIPWIIKPFYGYISDFYPLFGYKRKYYLILSGLISSISLGSMSLLVSNNDITNAKWIAVLLLTLTSLGTAFSDVLIDAIVVSKSSNKLSGSLQSICWTASSIGGLLSSYSSGILLDKYGSSWILCLTASFPLITSCVGIYLKEEKEEKEIVKVNKNINLILKTLKNKSIIYPIIFLILWQSTPSTGSSLFYFETNELGFKPEFFGQLSFVSSVSSIFGIYLYNKYLKSVSLHKLFKWSCIYGFIFSLTPLILVTHFNRFIGLPDKLFAIGDDIILTIFSQIAFMPVLILATEICPKGIEASLYALLMSINNLSGTIGSILGGIAVNMAGITENNFDNLGSLIIITSLLGLLPLFFLNLLHKK